MSTTSMHDPDPMYDDQTCGTYPSVLTQVQLEAVVKLERLDLYNQEKPFGAKAVWQHLEGIGIKICLRKEPSAGYWKNRG